MNALPDPSALTSGELLRYAAGLLHPPDAQRAGVEAMAMRRHYAEVRAQLRDIADTMSGDASPDIPAGWVPETWTATVGDQLEAMVREPDPAFTWETLRRAFRHADEHGPIVIPDDIPENPRAMYDAFEAAAAGEYGPMLRDAILNGPHPRIHITDPDLDADADDDEETP